MKHSQKNKGVFKKKPDSTPSVILYSIIIPTYNRASSLRDCLTSVASQSINRDLYEIVVVDDGSTDNTKDVVASFTRDIFPRTVYVYQENSGCAAARNAGIVEAKGEILFFTDDDCVVPPHWMETLLSGFTKHPEVVGVGGWYAYPKEEIATNKYAKIFDAIDRLSYFQYETYSVLSNNGGANPCGNTANVAYRKSVFDQVGLFDTYTKRTAMIDYELMLRIAFAGLYTFYTPLIITHAKRVGLREFINKPFRYGIADYYLSTRYSKKGSPRRLIDIFDHLHELKNRERSTSAPLYALFIVARVLGARYAKWRKIKSPILFRYRDVHRRWCQEFLSGAIQEQDFFTKLDYYDGRKFSATRHEVYELLYRQHKIPVCSIIIPFYNRAEYITPHFIKSFNDLEGDDSCAEIIFVDDGSTDATRKRLEEACAKLRFRARVIHQENMGPALARNRGIAAALGEYIFLTDSDVLVPKLWFNYLLLPQLYDEQVALSGGSQINPKPKTYFDKWRNSTINAAFFQIGNLYTSRPYDTANMCIKRSKVAPLGLLYFDTAFRELGCEDMDYAISIKKAGLRAAFLPFPVANVRSLNMRDFLSICVSRMSGSKMVKNKHADLKEMIPYYFYKTSNYSIADAVLKFVRWKKQRNYLLAKIYHHTVTGKEGGIIQSLVKNIAKSLSA